MPGDIWLTFPDATNDLTFASPTVSREHAALTLRDGRWYVEDCGSFNGTFLNGTRVQPGTPLPLRHADGPLFLAGAAPGPGHNGTAPRSRTGRPGAAVLLPAPGRAVSLRPLARRCEPREPSVQRTDRGPARHAWRNRHRQGGAAPDLREGRAFGPTCSREAARPLSRRPAARLGLKKSGEP